MWELCSIAEYRLSIRDIKLFLLSVTNEKDFLLVYVLCENVYRACPNLTDTTVSIFYGY